MSGWNWDKQIFNTPSLYDGFPMKGLKSPVSEQCISERLHGHPLVTS